MSRPYAEMIPTIRITLESMKATIVHAMNGQLDGVKEEIDRQLGSVIQNFNLEEVVRQEASSVLQKCVKDAIESAIRSLMWDSDFKPILTKAVRQAMIDHFSKEQP